MSITDRNMGSSSLLLMIDDFIDSPAFLKIWYVWQKKTSAKLFVIVQGKTKREASVAEYNEKT